MHQLAEGNGQSNANRYTSESLFLGKNELCISHGAEEYRLRITRQGKLILTK
ncbi:MAG: hemin uptake protein HemP [Candidatus Methylopumilus sp.]